MWKSENRKVSRGYEKLRGLLHPRLLSQRLLRNSENVAQLWEIRWKGQS